MTAPDGTNSTSESRRILFINDYAEGGGAEVVLRQLREGLESADPPWKTRLFYGYERNERNERKKGSPFSYIYSRHYKHKLRDTLTEFRPQVVHLLNYYHVLSPSVLDALRWYKKKHPELRVVYTAHDFHLICPNSGLTSFDTAGRIRREPPKRFPSGPRGWPLYFRRWDHRGRFFSLLKLLQWVWAYRWHRKERVIDAAISPGSFMYDAMSGLFGAERSFLIRNPFVTAGSAALMTKEMAPPALQPDEPLRLVFIGRLGQEKGLRPFLEHVPESMWLKIEIDIYGDGPDKGAIREYIDAHGLQERCRLMGRRPHQEIQKRLPDYHALALPSIWYENAPLSLVEAAFAGLRLIASEWGGVGQLAEFCGDAALIDPFDSESVGEALQTVRQAYEEGRPLQRDLKNLSEAFDFSRFINEHIRTYTSAGKAPST